MDQHYSVLEEIRQGLISDSFFFIYFIFLAAKLLFFADLFSCIYVIHLEDQHLLLAFLQLSLRKCLGSQFISF